MEKSIYNTKNFKNNCQNFDFTTREMEIVEHIRIGKPYKIIAFDLNISEKTVKNHVRNMYEKTGVSNKMELIHKLGIC